MKLQFLFFLIGLCFELGGTFFLLEAKALYFCVKVCPLYCSKRDKRDAGPPYWDDEFDDDTYISYDPYDHDRSYVYDERPHYHHHSRFYHYDPTTTTTSTSKPTTTTKKPSPSGICEFCNKKCGTPLV